MIKLNNKHLSLFLILLITILTCSVISAADTTDINNTNSITDNSQNSLIEINHNDPVQDNIVSSTKQSAKEDSNIVLSTNNNVVAEDNESNTEKTTKSVQKVNTKTTTKNADALEVRVYFSPYSNTPTYDDNVGAYIVTQNYMYLYTWSTTSPSGWFSYTDILNNGEIVNSAQTSTSSVSVRVPFNPGLNVITAKWQDGESTSNKLPIFYNDGKTHVDTSIDILSSKQINYGDTITIYTPVEPDGVGGTINLYIDGSNQASYKVSDVFDVENPDALITGGTLTPLKAGNITLQAKFLKNNYYEASESQTITVEVLPVETEITADPVEIESGETATLNVNLKDVNNEAVQNQDVTITVNGNSYTETTNDEGIATFNVNDLPDGENNVDMAYAGGEWQNRKFYEIFTVNNGNVYYNYPDEDYKHAATTGSTTITVKSADKPIKPKITVETNVKDEGIYAGETIRINGTISVDEDIDLTGIGISITLETDTEIISEEVYVDPDDEGNYIFKYDTNKITYATHVTVTTQFIKEANLEAIEDNPDDFGMEPEELEKFTDIEELTSEFDVIKIPVSLNVENVTTLVGQSATTKFNLKVNAPYELVNNINGNDPKYGTITLTLPNGTSETYDARTFSYSPDVTKNGTFIYKVSYQDDSGMYEDNETTFKVVVNNIKTSLTVEAKDIYVGQNVNISGTLTSDDENIDLNNKQIDLTINGTKYNAFTDKNGKFIFNQLTVSSVANDIEVTAVFNENGVLSSSDKVSDKFNVLAIPVKISADTPITTTVGKEVDMDITLLDTINDEVPRTGKIIITKDDESFTTLYLDSENDGDNLIINPDVTTDGTFVYKLVYQDDTGKYLSDETSVTVTVNKIETSIIVNSEDIYVDQNVSISGTLTAEGVNDLTDNEISLTISEDTFTTKTDKDGKFEFKDLVISEYAENVEVSAVFNEANGLSTSNVATSSFKVNLLPVSVNAVNITVKAKDEVKVPVSLSDLINGVVPSQGKITVSLNGNTIKTLDIKDDAVEFDPDTSKVGEYIYTITFEDGIKYDTNSTTVKVTVESIPTQIEVEAKNISAGQKVDISGKLTAEGNALSEQEVIITVNNTEYSVKTKEDGTFVLNNFTIDSEAVDVKVTAVFNENLPYATSNTAETTFNVSKINVELTSENKTTKVGSTVTVTVQAKDSLTNELPTQGTITITDANGNEIKTFDLSKDTVLEFTHEAVENGEFVYSIKYADENNKYYNNETTAKVTVEKLSTSISAEDQSVEFGTDATIKIDLKDENGNKPTEGTVTIFDESNNIIKTLDVSKDELEFTHTSNAPGNFEYTIKYSADKNYEPVETTVKFTVNNRDVTLEFVEVTDTVVGKNNTVSVKLTAGDNKVIDEYVTINIDGTDYVVKTDENGIATVSSFKSKVERKDVKVTASYPGNDSTGYSAAESIEDTFDVNKVGSIITIDPIDTVIYADNVTITGTLTDINNNKITRTTIKLTVNGITYSVKVDNTGRYSFTLPADIYEINTIKAEYKGSAKYVPATNTSTFNVIKKDTKITVDPVDSNVYGDKVVITGKLTDADGKELTNHDVQISVNNEKFTVKTDETGSYTLNINSDKVGNNSINVTFEGDDRYNQANNSATFKVNPKSTKLTIKTNNSKVDTPAIINITLTDDNDNPVTDKINVTINGETKEYTVTDGKLSIEYIPTNTQPVEVTVSYEGNDEKGYASAESQSVTINADKKATVVTVEPITSIVGETITLIAHVVDEEGNPVTGGNLVFKVNGITLREDGKFGSDAAPLKLKVENGIVEYQIRADLYLRNSKNLTASYSGSYKYYANKTEQNAPVEIALRTGNIKVDLNSTKVKQTETVKITATISDVTPKSENNKFIDTDDDYVFLKINGKTLKDEEGNQIKVNVENGVAVYEYTIPRGTAGSQNGTDKEYTVTAGFSNSNYYPDTKDNASFTVERSPITVTINQASFENQKLTIKGSIVDEFGLNVIGLNKVCVKINGKTYSVNDEKQYYSINDGNIDLSINLVSAVTHVETVQIVTGDRQAYLEGRSAVLEI